MLKSLKEATARYELGLENSHEMCVLQEDVKMDGGERQTDGWVLLSKHWSGRRVKLSVVKLQIWKVFIFKK